jgi:AcrR family transcriptional regulator
MARPKTLTPEVGERLMACALDMVRDEGVGSLALRALAQRAQTSTTAVYALFGSKEALQRAVLVNAFGQFAAAQESAPVVDDPVTDIAGLGALYVQWALEHPRLYEAMYGDDLAGVAPSAELQAARTRSMARLTAAVHRGLTTGVFTPASETTIVTSLWAQVHGLASLMIAGHLPHDADPGAAAYAAIEGWRAHPGRLSPPA